MYFCVIIINQNIKSRIWQYQQQKQSVHQKVQLEN